MKYKCKICNKNTLIKTFRGRYSPLCYQHYMDYVNGKEKDVEFNDSVKKNLKEISDILARGKLI